MMRLYVSKMLRIVVPPVVCGILITVAGMSNAVSASKSAKDFDTNGRLGLQAEEYTKLCDHVASNQTDVEHFRDKCLQTFSSFEFNNPNETGFPTDVANKHFFPGAIEKLKFGSFTEKGDIWNRGSPGFVVRRKHEDISIHQATDALDGIHGLKVAEGALFSYTFDFKNDGDIYQAHGVVSYPLFWERNDAAVPEFDPYLGQILLLPSVSFDRVENDVNPRKDVNSLAFRLGTEFRLKRFLFSTQYLSMNAVFNTEFGFDTSIFAGEANWRFVARELGIGQAVPRDPSSFFYFRWKPQLHFEWGYVTDSGGNANLRNDQEFARFGPQIHADLWVGDRTKLYANFEYYASLTNSAKSSHLLETGLEFSLDPETNHWTFGVEYRHGKIPLKLDETETITAGLGIKF